MKVNNFSSDSRLLVSFKSNYSVFIRVEQSEWIQNSSSPLSAARSLHGTHLQYAYCQQALFSGNVLQKLRVRFVKGAEVKYSDKEHTRGTPLTRNKGKISFFNS